MIPTLQLGQFGRSALDHDPYWDSVKLLLHMDGANNSTTFTDVKGHTVTPQNNAKISTAQSKFGGSSGLFAGAGNTTAGDYLVTATSSDFTSGTGDWTFEYWLRVNSMPATSAILLDGRPATTEGLYITMYMTSGGVLKYYSNSADRITGATLSTATWYHIALSKVSGSTKLFVDGTQSGSTYTDSENYADTRFIVAASGWHVSPAIGQFGFNGNIDDMRFTKGVGRYTGTFSVPTADFPNG